MNEIDSLMGTGKAIADGSSIITVGTVTGIAIGATAATVIGIGIATSSAPTKRLPHNWLTRRGACHRARADRNHRLGRVGIRPGYVQRVIARRNACWNLQI